jgi:hypothetical protein
MKIEGMDIFKTPNGYCKRLPDCILGPFPTLREAKAAYKQDKTKKDTVIIKKKKEEVKKEETTGVI